MFIFKKPHQLRIQLKARELLRGFARTEEFKSNTIMLTMGSLHQKGLGKRFRDVDRP